MLSRKTIVLWMAWASVLGSAIGTNPQEPTAEELASIEPVEWSRIEAEVSELKERIAAMGPVVSELRQRGHRPGLTGTIPTLKKASSTVNVTAAMVENFVIFQVKTAETLRA